MTAAAAPHLRCTGLEAAYDGHQVLFGVDAVVDRGEIVALLGTNGAGKSTLLGTISQLITPSAGTIELDGSDVTGIGPLAATRRGVVHVPGGRGTFPTLTVAEHFKASSYLCDDRALVEERVAHALEIFPGVRRHWNRQAGVLSGGEQQQLALATVLLADPTLLLLDELSLGLAPRVVGELLEVVRMIAARGCAVLVVEQSVDVAATIAERAYFMEKGRIRFSGPTGALLGRSDLLRPVFIPGPARAPGEHAPSPTADAAALPSALTVRSLTKRFGGVTALDGVSFDIPVGAIVGLIGPNGAGKTTVLDIVSGVVPPDHGQVVIGGEDVTHLSTHRRARLGLGRSFQDARIFPSLTVAEAIAVAFEAHLPVRDHLASIVALPAARAMEEGLALQVDDLVGVLGLQAHRDTKVGELSTGTRRIVELAMAMAHRPRVLLMDEPSSGLAQRETEALAGPLLRLRDETGCALLVVEHDMSLVGSISDELIGLVVGRVIARGAPSDVLGDRTVVEAYFGVGVPDH